MLTIGDPSNLIWKHMKNISKTAGMVLGLTCKNVTPNSDQCANTQMFVFLFCRHKQSVFCNSNAMHVLAK